MIIQTITLHDFGIYAGQHTFNLTPTHNGRYQQPIILLRGQNGVGKSTIMEAIRLALHGKLSLGRRTTQKEYEQYLAQRLHRDAQGETAVTAAVELTFDHVFLGQSQRYRVRRQWSNGNGRLSAELHLWVNETTHTGSEEEAEYLLRELVPSGVAELFFFDGEKITTLAEAGDASDALLGETVKNLLGLHLVEQLDRDLDIYLTRQTGIQALQQYQLELTQLHEEYAALQQKYEQNHDMLVDCRHRLAAKREEIGLLENRIAREGGQYAAEETARHEQREAIVAVLGQSQQAIEELCRGVFPFAVAPNLLTAVRQRLEQEAAYEQWQNAQPTLKRLETLVIRESPAEYQTEPPHLVAGIQQILEEGRTPPIAESEIVHRVSAEMRGVLFNWMDEALSSSPQQMAEALQKREALKAELARVDESLKRVPASQILQPLQDELRLLDRELGRLEAELERLQTEEKRLAFYQERAASSKRKISEKMATIETDEGRIQLAARTQLLLDQYQQRLIRQKLAQLEIQLVKRFNQLSRKRNFIDQVVVDAQTFTIGLYRAGKLFPRTQLSAGEEQIFAVATLWALREVSERPLPVIIDTPLSRLDDEHRRTMLAEFMPQVAQQVIVLATNVEIDDTTAHFLQPVTAREYHLQADGVTTKVSEQVYEQRPLIPIDEVQLHAVQ